MRRSTFSRAGARGFALAISLATMCALGTVWAAGASALVSPVSVLAGPSSAIVDTGDVALAPDGTGGMVFEMLTGGQPHVFVSQYLDGRWDAPIRVDTDNPYPASYPAVAAADGGELLVVWVQPWVSISTNGGSPQTYDELMSAEMAPNSTSFQPAEPVDPNNVGAYGDVYPSLAMAPDGAAYVVYRVIVNPLVSTAFTNPPIPPLRPGDEEVEVRVSHFNGLYWTSLGAVNAYPDQVSTRPPTPSNAPAIAIDRSGQGIVVWQEPTIDGTARIWARRLFGNSFGNALQVSPDTINGTQVTADADAPAVAFGLYANAEVMFRLQGGAGSPLGGPEEFVDSLAGSDSQTGGDAFGTAQPVITAAGAGPPSIATDSFGNFQAAFTANGQAEVVGGEGNSVDTLEAVGAASGDPAQAILDPGGGSAVVWPGTDSQGRSVVDVQEVLPSGAMQSASLSAPLTGQISDLTLGASGAGDGLIGFQQGTGSTTQVAVATVQAPAARFSITGPFRWVAPGTAALSWSPARTTIGPISYSVILDGRTVASDLTARTLPLASLGLGSGSYTVRVLAVDQIGQQTATGSTSLQIDAGPPSVSLRTLGRARVRVTVVDRHSGPRTAGTVINFGDGSPPVFNQLSAAHRYVRAGTYVISVRCTSNVGIRAVHHLLVRVR